MGEEIGFANLPNQIHRQSTKHAFEFTIMVAGESGLGKSTLLNTLFATDVFVPAPYDAPGKRIPSTSSVQASTVLLQESGVRLELTTIDTPGFGNAVNNNNCWEPIVSYIEQAFSQYMDDESQIGRSRVSDRRVHCCLYFIEANGHGLKPLDIHVMGLLQDKVNVVPIIAKADTLTADECQEFKSKVMQDLEENGIKVYHFPNNTDDDDEDDLPTEECIPFAVSAAQSTIDVGGKAVRGRQYPWGTAPVDSKAVSDFTTLRNMLIRTHMHDLIDVTASNHYERYRFHNLSQLSTSAPTADSDASQNPMAQFAQEKDEHERKMRKMEAEMSQVFEAKVREKEKKLQETEVQLLKRHDEMKRDLQQRQRVLEQRKADFAQEKSSADRDREDRTKAALSRSSSALMQKKKKSLFGHD